MLLSLTAGRMSAQNGTDVAGGCQINSWDQWLHILKVVTNLRSIKTHTWHITYQPIISTNLYFPYFFSKQHILQTVNLQATKKIPSRRELNDLSIDMHCYILLTNFFFAQKESYMIHKNHIWFVKNHIWFDSSNHIWFLRIIYDFFGRKKSSSKVYNNAYL